jgi:hypothetical protein
LYIICILDAGNANSQDGQA